jgi:hypothetical protein
LAESVGKCAGMMRASTLLFLLLLSGCQITINPSVFNEDEEYLGLRATFTISPDMLPADPYDDYLPDDPVGKGVPFPPPPAAKDDNDDTD